MSPEDRLDRLMDLTCLAWQALISAEPNANPDSLAVKALKLAEAMLKVEEKNFASP